MKSLHTHTNSTRRKTVNTLKPTKEQRAYNRAFARKCRISERKPSTVATLKFRLDYVKQGYCPFSFDAYPSTPVRGLYRLARGKRTTLSSNFPYSALSPRKQLKLLKTKEAQQRLTFLASLDPNRYTQTQG